MAMQMDAEGFGTCSNLSQCEAVCPKEISVRVIAEFNADLVKAQLKGWAVADRRCAAARECGPRRKPSVGWSRFLSSRSSSRVGAPCVSTQEP